MKEEDSTAMSHSTGLGCGAQVEFVRVGQVKMLRGRRIYYRGSVEERQDGEA